MTSSPRARSVSAVVSCDPQDAALLARIQAGDDRALGIIYDLHASVIYGVARRVTRDEHLARDITQDVFAYLWELPNRVDLLQGSLRTYLAMVAHRRAVDEVRRTERRRRTETSAIYSDAIDGPDVEVVDADTQNWRSGRLAACVAELPAEQRTALELAYYQGLTYKQVAEALAIPEGTAKSRLRLAMTRLRAVLGDDMRTAI